ncbi:MAG: hypothetical protein IPL35_03185 [Sphingobacteriales bacterium]|nr:hypothetical protein [Sphingobacteriales bacterium]
MRETTLLRMQLSNTGYNSGDYMPSLSTLRNTAVAVMVLLLGVFMVKEDKPDPAAEIEVSLKELNAVVKENKQNSNPQKTQKLCP